MLSLNMPLGVTIFNLNLLKPHKNLIKPINISKLFKKKKNPSEFLCSKFCMFMLNILLSTLY